jgi:hypothetical protein
MELAIVLLLNKCSKTLFLYFSKTISDNSFLDDCCAEAFALVEALTCCICKTIVDIDATGTRAINTMIPILELLTMLILVWMKIDMNIASIIVFFNVLCRSVFTYSRLIRSTVSCANLFH